MEELHIDDLEIRMDFVGWLGYLDHLNTTGYRYGNLFNVALGCGCMLSEVVGMSYGELLSFVKSRSARVAGKK